jgi:hypothetical protein
MRRGVWVLLVGSAVSLLSGCDSSTVVGTEVGSGVLATESRPVRSFAVVAVNGAGHVIIEPTGAESLQITAEEDLLPLIRSDVVGDRLVLGFEPGVSVTTTREVLYRLTVTDLTGIEASGASRVEAHGIDTSALATVLSGASSLTVDGRADAQILVVSGASRYEADNLRSRVATATLSGASYGVVRVSDVLTATVSGGSTLEYFGSPTVTTTVSSGSTVRQAGE